MTPPMVELPELRLSVAGKAVEETWSRALIGLQVRRRLGLPTQCELRLDGTELGKLVPRDWARGTPIQVRLPQQEPVAVLFEGELAGVEQSYPPGGGRELRLRAYDPLFRLASRRSIRGFRKLTVAELARELVSDLGLGVQAGEAGPTRRWIVQHRQTDLELLRQHTESMGLYASVRGRKLHLVTLEGGTECLELEQGSTLLESRFDIVGERPGETVTALGWDPATGTVAQGQAQRPRSGRQVDWALSGSAQSAVPLPDLGLEEVKQVEGAAQAALDWDACREITLWGVADGDVRLEPGCAVNIRGVDASVEGRFVLSSVRHCVDRTGGFTSEISSYPPRLAPSPTSTTIVPGIVTSVSDPDGMGRVKAALSTLAGFETDWMRVMGPGLGKKRGFVALPDVDDQVAVALSHGDPARGLVLGSLFDGRGDLDSGVEGGRVRRFQFRAGEQMLTLDEKQGRVRLENEEGSFIEMTPKGMTVHSEGHLSLEAPGKRLRLRASRIDMEKA